MNRGTKRKTSWLGLAIVVLVALFVGQQWLPVDLQPTIGTPTVSSPPAGSVPDALAGFPTEERLAITATLKLIKSGGPFPYAKDGSEFSNREGRLPGKGPGYYREFTVETPGSPDRGARRIVSGRNDEVYYTRDHYRSFIRLN